MASHHLHHEHLGGGLGHRGDIKRGLERRDRDILRDRAETRAAIGVGQVVVDRLGHADAGDRVAELLAHLRDLVRGVHRVVAAVVEEVADVVGLEDLDQPLVLGAVLVEALELEARRAESAGGRVLEALDRRLVLLRAVDEVLMQRADDAVAAGVDLADVLRIPGRGLDDPRRRGVDDGGDAARLGVEGVAGGGTGGLRRGLAAGLFHGAAG